MLQSPTSLALRRLVASARSSLKRLPASSHSTAAYTTILPNDLVSDDGPARLRAEAPRQGAPRGTGSAPAPEAAAAAISALSTRDDGAAAACPSGSQRAETSSTQQLLLPNDLLLRILQLLPPQELACDGRRVCRAAASHFCAPADLTVRLSLPMDPKMAHRWREGAGPGLKQLTMWRKLALLSTAAATGCEANLDAAWALVSPGVALDVECNPRLYIDTYGSGADPGSAAASCGHLHLLPWLVQHGVPLDSEAALVAAAPHGDLATLQRTLLLLHSRLDSSRFATTHLQLLRAVACGGGPHATAKLAWLLPQRRDELSRTNVLWYVSGDACRAPDPIPLLEWVQERGFDLRAEPLVAHAVAYSSLEVVEWLAGEAGCPLLARDSSSLEQRIFGFRIGGSPVSALKLAINAAGSGSVEKVRWVQQQGVVLQQLGNPELVLSAAAERRHTNVVRYLHEECGIELQADVADSAVLAGCVELAAWLLSKGCSPSAREAYEVSCRNGDAPMLLWLLHGAKCPVGRLTAESVQRWWPRQSEGRPGQLVDPAVVEARLWPRGVDDSAGQVVNVLRAVLEAGCPLGNGPTVLRGALIRGDLALARCLHEEHGIELDPWALCEATRSGCEALMEWVAAVAGSRRGEGRLDLYQYHPEWDPYPEAAACRDLASMRCLRRLVVPVGAETLWRAVSRCAPLTALGMLVDWGAAPSRQEVRRALEAAGRARRSREVLVWLRGLMRGLPVAAGDRRGEGVGGGGAGGFRGGGWQRGEEAGAGGWWGWWAWLGQGQWCRGCM